MLRFAPGPASHRQSRGGSGQARTFPELGAASSVGSFAEKSYRQQQRRGVNRKGFVGVSGREFGVDTEQRKKVGAGVCV